MIAPRTSEYARRPGRRRRSGRCRSILEGAQRVRDELPKLGMTRGQRRLRHIKPDAVSVQVDEDGGPEGTAKRCVFNQLGGQALWR